jgi:hypothetical protein
MRAGVGQLQRGDAGVSGKWHAEKREPRSNKTCRPSVTVIFANLEAKSTKR